jgi:AraC-like DNA-binding protein
MDSLLTRNTLVEVHRYLEQTRPEQVSYRQILDLARRTVAFDEAFVVTTLLRGTLQIVQPQRLSESVSRTYDRDGQAVDRLSWRAIRDGEAVTSVVDDAGAFGESFMSPLGLRHVAVVPLTGPLLSGYPGALHVYRGGETEAFSQAELEVLTDLAARLDELQVIVRAGRATSAHDDTAAAGAIPAGRVRMAFFDRDGAQMKFAARSTFDETTLSRMSQMALNRLSREKNGDDIVGDRVLVSDAGGDHLTHRVVTYNRYPALHDGRFVGFFAQPHPGELAVLRSGDVGADTELSRLVPALRYMHAEFRKSPTLVDIAKAVHLSPFHFHRRFTELLGLTPKHYLLDCQIAEAKRQLLLGEKDLATIAAEGGFAHQSHFTSRFKQATGQTPTRWRRMALDRSER